MAPCPFVPVPPTPKCCYFPLSEPVWCHPCDLHISRAVCVLITALLSPWGVWGAPGCPQPHGSQELVPEGNAAACAQRTEPGLKAGVKKGGKKQHNEKLETLIRSSLSKELLRRRNCSVPSASITVGWDVRPCLVQRALRNPELMALLQLLARGFCSPGVTSSFFTLNSV